MLRSSIVRAAGSGSLGLRQSTRASQTAPAALASINNAQQSRQAHAISNPTLASIEKRWEAMPPQEQADLWMALRDRMKVDWNELTTQEKKAGTSTTKLVSIYVVVSPVERVCTAALRSEPASDHG